MSCDDNFNSLVGKRVNSVFVSKCGNYLRFLIDAEEAPMEFEALDDSMYGESSAHFEDILGVDALLGQVVVSTAALAVTNHHTECQHRTQLFGFEIRTRLGVCTIVFRHDDNGYYCGSMQRMDYIPRFGTQWHPITTDWSWSGGDE